MDRERDLAAEPASGETVTERWAKSFEAPPPPPTQGEEELREWAEKRADDAGRLAREVLALRQRANEATRAALAAEPATDPPRAKQSTTGDPWADVRDEATRAENEACALRLDEEAKRHEDAMGRLGPADGGEEEYTMHLVAATDFRSVAAAIRARIAPKDKL